MAATQDKIIAIGISTGGPDALREVLAQFPADCPPIIIVQHMPAFFVASFASSLDLNCEISVKEAQDGDLLEAGQALIAPGGVHLVLRRSGHGFAVRLTDGEPVCRCKPSVDVLFRSVAKVAKARAVGVIMTGMGKDGAEGLGEMRSAGARTLGQDKASSVIYGMPRVAFETGAVERQVPLDQIAPHALRLARA